MSRNADRALIAEVDRLGMPQVVAATRSDFSDTVLSLARTRGRPISKNHRRQLEAWLLTAKRITAKFPGVPINWSDSKWVDAQIAALGREEEAPQVNGAAFIRSFCMFAVLFPEEFAAMAQLLPQIINARIVSPAAQQWIFWWATGIEAVLEHRPFDEFAVNHADRHAALTALANEVFRRMVEEFGREKIMPIMAAMLASGELKASPVNLGKN